MRASYEIVRQDPGLLWFPVISTCCLAVTAGFWLFEGAWLYAVSGPWFLYPPLVAVALYSVLFVGIFFNVALVGAAARPRGRVGRCRRRRQRRLVASERDRRLGRLLLVRQVFAVELYRGSAADVSLAAA